VSSEDIVLISIAIFVGGFFVIGGVMLIWAELKLEFKKRRELRELGKKNQEKRERGA
jgi:hypothetical protein